MAISVKIITDSINPSGIRITTFLLRYPRFIHSEFMTHRVFSRNAASSRAIPVAKIIKEIQEDPAMPIFWGAAQKGMQSEHELEQPRKEHCIREWLMARDDAIHYAEIMIGRGLHKQIANRILEPWMHMSTLATATEIGNFFNLRVHKMAQPEFQELAKQMLLACQKSTPRLLEWNQWHLPYSDQCLAEFDLETKLKACTARAARTSYRNFEGKIEIGKDIELHDKLAASGHWSPFEHCAKASPTFNGSPSNFHYSWMQYRKTFRNENQNVFDALALLKNLEDK